MAREPINLPKEDSDCGTPGHLSQSEKEEARYAYERQKRRDFARLVAEELKEIMPKANAPHECRLSDEAILFFSTPDTIFMLKGMSKAYRESEETRKYIHYAILGTSIAGILGFMGTVFLIGLKMWPHIPEAK